MLFLILRYLSDLRKTHKRQVKIICYNQSVLAAGEQVVLLLGHEESK